jgi:hypothetical protein
MNKTYRRQARDQIHNGMTVKMILEYDSCNVFDRTEVSEKPITTAKRK